jgi:hypothetical protein
MKQVRTAINFNDLNVHYYEEGILLVSTIDVKKYEKSESNYEVPITIVVNETFGIKVIHGLFVHSMFDVDRDNFLFDQGILLMNKTNNWLIFFPAKTFATETQREAIIKQLQAELHEPLNIYSITTHPTSAKYNAEQRTAFVYGLGVE